jgi:hypothetical protein
VQPRSRAKIQPGPIPLRSARGYRRVWIPFGLLLSAGVAVATALWLPEGLWPPWMLNQRQSVAPAPEKEEHRTPRLAFHTSRATINQPLPLGIVLNNSAGQETLVLSGFVEGTTLSAGTALSATRWSVPGRDLDNAFISAPENFDGTMQVTVTLYSSRQDILETKEVRFEWSGSSKGDKLPVTISPAQRLSR